MIIEVKVKTNANKEEKWESLPIVGVFPFRESSNEREDNKTLVEFIKSQYVESDTFKIRWNNRGSLQGNYIDLDNKPVKHVPDRMDSLEKTTKRADKPVLDKHKSVIITVSEGLITEIYYQPEDINVLIIDYNEIMENDAISCPHCNEVAAIRKNNGICPECGFDTYNPENHLGDI